MNNTKAIQARKIDKAPMVFFAVEQLQCETKRLVRFEHFHSRIDVTGVVSNF